MLRFFRNKKKIFCIGFNKTGTTSLNYLFKDLGFKVSPQLLQEKTLDNIHLVYDKNKLQRYINKYDFFQDAPFSISDFYIRLDTLYPNSKFILTIRDEEKWFNSLSNFHLKIYQKKDNKIKKISDINENKLRLITWVHKNYFYNLTKKYLISEVINNKAYPNWDLLYNKKHYINLYVQRNNSIIKFFQDRPDQLLILDLEKEKSTSNLFEFLDIKSKMIEFPHLNKS